MDTTFVLNETSNVIEHTNVIKCINNSLQSAKIKWPDGWSNMEVVLSHDVIV